MIFTTCYDGKHRKCSGVLKLWGERAADSPEALCSCECHKRKEAQS